MRSFSSLAVLFLIGFRCYADDGPFKAEKPVLRDVEPCGTIKFEDTGFREWTDPYGHAVRARLAGFAGALIYLEMGDDVAPYPLAGVSTKDRDYVRSLFRSADREQFFPGVGDPQDEATRMVLPEEKWQAKIDAWTRVINAKKRTLADALAARNHLCNIRDPKALDVLISTLAKNPLDRAVVTVPGWLTPAERPSRPDLGRFGPSDLAEANRRLATVKIAGKITNDSARTAYVEAIAKFDEKRTFQTLVKTAIADKSGGVRAAAVWALCNFKDRALVLAEYAKYLNKKEHRDSALAGLFTSDITLRGEDSDLSSYELNKSLIDLLVVEQPIDVPCYSWYLQWRCFFGTRSRGSFAHYQAGGFSKRFWVPVPCEMAHDMLVRQSGYDYGYDRKNWSEWNKEQTSVRSQSKRETDLNK